LTLESLFSNWYELLGGGGGTKFGDEMDLLTEIDLHFWDGIGF
jgi:hypothetical protein